MSSSTSSANFSSGGAYEMYMGRWSRLVAPVFLEWLSIEAGSRWLDVGSGTGELTLPILSNCAP
jgi:ubiquinone/menaquinone biosynthesis C-methylase UbiE